MSKSDMCKMLDEDYGKLSKKEKKELDNFADEIGKVSGKDRLVIAMNFGNESVETVMNGEITNNQRLNAMRILLIKILDILDTFRE
jgi:hypothetical protein